MTTKAMEVFLSYAPEDAELARTLAAGLEEQGFTVWADWTFSGDSDWRDTLQAALEESRNFLLLFTPAALSSRWSHFETGVALGRAQTSPGIRIIPVLVNVSSEKLPASLRKRILVNADPDHLDRAGDLIARQLNDSLLLEPRFIVR